MVKNLRYFLTAIITKNDFLLIFAKKNCLLILTKSYHVKTEKFKI